MKDTSSQDGAAEMPAQPAADNPPPIVHQQTMRVTDSQASGHRPSPVDLAEAGFQRLSPEYIRFERRTGYVFTAVVLSVLLAVSGPLLVWREAWPWLPIGAAVGWLLLTSLLVWSSHFWPPISYRHIQWRLDETGMEIHRGVWWQHRVAVPLGRVQHVDVSQGPIQRWFGLGTLTIHTAGTKNASVELEGLEHDVALSLRDRLIEWKESADVL